jgi:dimethylaniline monooxygenase (N-oxide forming)
MVSSKKLTTFSDFRLPLDAPDFLSTTTYCNYLEDYCTNFKLWPHILLSTKVIKIRRVEGKQHNVTSISSDGKSDDWPCDAVAICTGLHVVPNIPHIKGIKNIPKVLHSSEFKEKSQFGAGKAVMILGSGETGMDLAYLAVTSLTNSVTLCHRDGFLCAPKVSLSTLYNTF